MKVINGKITCVACGSIGATFGRQQGDKAILKCNLCYRKVKVNRMKLAEALFDIKSMEGKSLI